MEVLYEQNLLQFSEENPEAAAHLVGLKNEGDLPPSSEFSSLLHDIDLDSTEVLFSIGLVDNPIEKIGNWLEGDCKRRFIIFEDDLCVIHQFLKGKHASVFFSHPQTQLLWLHGKDPFRRVTWTYLNRVMSVICLKKGMEELTQELYNKAAKKNAIVTEFLEWGKDFFCNFYRNLAVLPNAYLGESLFGRFEGVPAIICGAGPSLEKHLETLEKLKEKAILIAGGSARNVLDSYGIRPHFGAGIDPGEEQYNRVRSAKHNEVPFLYRDRIHYKALLEMRGPRFHFSGSGGYPVGRWVAEQLNLPIVDFDEGHNVVHFCTSIAEKMGCNPIIFIGMDLAYTSGKAYAEGVSNRNSKVEGITARDIYGNKTQTKRAWQVEAEWLSAFAKGHPSVHLINATEGGIGFCGIENVELKVFSKENLSGTYMIEKELMKGKKTGIKKQQIDFLFEELKKSLEKCQEKLSKILHLVEPIVLYEVELEEEEAYEAILKPFDLIHQRIAESQEVELDRSELRVSRSKYLLRVIQENLICLKCALQK